MATFRVHVVQVGDALPEATVADPYATFRTSMNRLAGTTDLEAQGAAQVWANAPGMSLVGCLNKKNGTDGIELLGVVNALAGTTGLGLNAAAAAIVA
jgi:hypothetical protein